MSSSKPLVPYGDMALRTRGRTTDRPWDAAHRERRRGPARKRADLPVLGKVCRTRRARACREEAGTFLSSVHGRRAMSDDVKAANAGGAEEDRPPGWRLTRRAFLAGCAATAGIPEPLIRVRTPRSAGGPQTTTRPC